VSVTIKLANGDAKLVGDLLQDLVNLNRKVLEGKSNLQDTKALQHRINSIVMANHVQELVGAFHTAVRANTK
jgi:hypothetical protein